MAKKNFLELLNKAKEALKPKDTKPSVDFTLPEDMPDDSAPYAFAMKCSSCGELMPRDHAGTFVGRCVNCAEKEVVASRNKTIKAAFYIIISALIIIVAYFLLFKPLFGDRFIPLQEKKIIGNIFTAKFLFFIMELVVLTAVAYKYFMRYGAGAGDKPAMIIATTVMMCLSLLMLALVAGSRFFVAYDIILAVALLGVAGLYFKKHYDAAVLVKRFKEDTIMFRAKVLKLDESGENVDKGVEKLENAAATVKDEKTDIIDEEVDTEQDVVIEAPRIALPDFVLEQAGILPDYKSLGKKNKRAEGILPVVLDDGATGLPEDTDRYLEDAVDSPIVATTPYVPPVEEPDDDSVYTI